MTNKIIIDGVDVSECPENYNGWSRLYRDTRPMCERSYDRECEPRKLKCDHYVKCLEQKLLKKEQECESWKSAFSLETKMLERTEERESDLEKQLDQLKAENSKLQKEVNDINVIFMREHIWELKAENEKLKEAIKAYQEDRFCQGGCAIYQYDKIHKLTQALDEIEQYITKQFCDNCEEIGSTELTSHCEFCEYGELLDIIDKAKGEE